MEKISFIRSCDVEEIKATDCIIKVHITSGNIKWRSFALRFCVSNPKSAWQALLPSTKGLSLLLSSTLMQESWWSSPFLFDFILWEAQHLGKSMIYISIGCGGAWVIIVDITLEVKGCGAKLQAPIFLCVRLKLHNHKYCVSVSNCRRLYDSWACGLAEKLYSWLFLMLW